MAIKLSSAGGRMARARIRQRTVVKRRYASPFKNAQRRGPLRTYVYLMTPGKNAARRLRLGF